MTAGLNEREHRVPERKRGSLLAEWEGLWDSLESEAISTWMESLWKLSQVLSIISGWYRNTGRTGLRSWKPWDTIWWRSIFPGSSMSGRTACALGWITRFSCAMSRNITGYCCEADKMAVYKGKFCHSHLGGGWVWLLCEWYDIHGRNKADDGWHWGRECKLCDCKGLVQTGTRLYRSQAVDSKDLPSFHVCLIALTDN